MHLNFFRTKGVQLTQQKEPGAEGEAPWLSSQLMADPVTWGLSFPHVEHGLSKSNKREANGGTDHITVGSQEGDGSFEQELREEFWVICRHWVTLTRHIPTG